MRQLAFLLYFPPMIATSAISILCSLLLISGERSGLFVILYAAMTFILFRRARRIRAWDPAEEGKPLDVRLDIGLMSVLNFLLFGLAIAYFVG